VSVRVLFFGAIADKLGKRSLEVQPNQNLTELIEASGCAAFAPFLVAVNQDQVHDMNILLKAGDEVAIMPPFSGG